MIHAYMSAGVVVAGDVVHKHPEHNAARNILKLGINGAILVSFGTMHAHAAACP